MKTFADPLFGTDAARTFQLLPHLLYNQFYISYIIWSSGCSETVHAIAEFTLGVNDVVFTVNAAAEPTTTVCVA